MKTQPATQLFDKDALKLEYGKLRPLYERLAVNFQQALKTFLAENGIPYLDITYRTKDFDSAVEKIGRKGYQHPFKEIEDWCGLRVICYYPSDVKRICDIIEREFDVHEEEDKANLLGPHEFGYRSTHFIVQVKNAWLQAPNYRGLGEFKAEIQVRTILMHAWAEIEHKLAYKSAEQVPDKFRRKLYRLSAKFEETDEQFDELRAGLTEYRSQVRASAQEAGEFNRNLELNLDTLQAFMDYYFPDRAKNIDSTGALLEEMRPSGLTMHDLVEVYQKTGKFLSEIERDYLEAMTSNVGQDSAGFKSHWTQPGALRALLDIASSKYHNLRPKKNPIWLKLVVKWRSRIGIQ